MTVHTVPAVRSVHMSIMYVYSVHSVHSACRFHLSLHIVLCRQRTHEGHYSTKLNSENRLPKDTGDRVWLLTDTRGWTREEEGQSKTAKMQFNKSTQVRMETAEATHPGDILSLQDGSA